MKLNRLILIMALPYVIKATDVLAQSESAPKKEGQYKGVEAEDSILDKLMTVPGVKKAYDDCKERHTTKLEEIPGCIWTDGGLTADQKKKVQQLYAEEEANKKNKETLTHSAKDEAIDKTTKEAFKTNLSESKYSVKNDYKNDPAVQALSAFFGKKLEEVLSNPEDIKNKKIATIDHTKFIELFSNELGKSVINAFTSYCMETKDTCRTDLENTCIIPKSDTSRKKAITDNLDKLKKATFSEKEGKLWEKCIGDVSVVCYDQSKIVGGNDEDNKYSQQRACLVMDFVKSARKSLLAADEQMKFYNGIEGGRGIASVATNMNVLDNDKKMKADTLMQINSSDLDKEFKNAENKNIKISSTNQNVVDEAQECEKQMDQEKCKKFLNTDVSKNKDALIEMGVKQLAQGDELSEKLEKDENVKSYLQEEGYTKEQILEMTKKENIEEIRKQISDRYKAEKEAIIREMAQKIENKSSTENGKISNGDKSKMDKIKEEMASRNNDLKDLIHFNNIVSSYLSIEDENNKKSRNTASLYSEVESYKDEGSKELQENLKNAKDMARQENSSKLDVKTINEALIKKYQDKKENDSNGK